jgi:peptidoglycan/LPS O-acetylase OafA/YrhL
MEKLTLNPSASVAHVSHNDNMHYSDNLTFIRSLLALGVVAFHVFGVIGISYWQFPWVPGFIAISGYVITQSMSSSRGYAHFAWKRLLRVGPTFLLSLALVALLGGSVYGALSDWLSILLNLAHTGTNEPLWSLSLEEMLYFSLAVMFSAGIYRNPNKATETLIALFVLAPVAVNFLPTAQAPIAPVTTAFACGSLLYVKKDHINWSTLAGSLCLAVAITLRNSRLHLDTTTYALLVAPPLAYGLITLAVHSKPVFATYKDVVGDPSLGIYVYHWPIMIWLQNQGLNDLGLVAATLCLTMLLAFFSWHAIEKRALQLKDWRLYQGDRSRQQDDAN